MSGELAVPGEADDAIAGAMAEAARLGEQAARMAEAGTGGNLVPAGSGAVAEQTRSAMIEARQQGATVATQLREARRRTKELIDAKKRALDAQLEEMTAALAPLQRQVERWQEGIWSVSLYLGVGEDLVTLLDGEPAPAGTPIYVRQGVLAMDEECAVVADRGGIDFTQVQTFDGWITASPERVEQLIPEPRGVVAIMPRRSDKDYGGGVADMVGNKANHQTYLLIRNGSCLYRYVAQDFEAGRRLTPRRDEFTKLFTNRRYDFAAGGYVEEALEPGTRAWGHAEQQAGAVERHYMRVALILQGLIDRTMCFAPLPAQRVSLLSMDSYEAGHVVLVGDDEKTLTAGRPPFRQWLAERNAKLRPGMRIVGNFACTAWDNVNTCSDGSGHRTSWEHSRIHPKSASHPVTGEIYRIERREGSSLVFLYDRTDEVWRRDVPFPDKPGWVYSAPMPTAPKVRASARIRPDDGFVIPVDLVTTEECTAYLHSRADRHAYVDMFPVLRAAIAAIKAEQEAEAPMRQLVTSCIAADHQVSFEEAGQATADLVSWWKLANRWHRPLIMRDDPAAEGRALAAISAEFGARRRAVTSPDEVQTAAALREDIPAAMAVARRRDGGWVVLEPQPRDVAGEPGRVWVREHTWNKSRTRHETRDWVLPEPSQVTRWRMLWTGGPWPDWDHGASRSQHLTDPEIAAMVTWACEQAEAQAGESRRGGPARGGQPVAVGRQRGLQGWTLYWLDGRDSADAVRGSELQVTWRRTTGNAVAFEAGYLYGHTWHRRPWPEGSDDHLTWRNDAAVAALDTRLEHAEHERARERVISGNARAACQRIAAQWELEARERDRREFVTRYADEALWAEHAASKRYDCPHLGWAGHPTPWEEAVLWLIQRERDIGGLTVAEAAGLYAALSGSQIEVPEDLAGLRFGPQEGSDDGD